MLSNSPARSLLLALTIAMLMVSRPIGASADQQPSLLSLGQVPNVGNALANAVSSDGTVVTGEGFGGGPQVVYSWTAGTITSSNLLNSTGTSISSDGSVIAGTLGLNAQTQAFRWRAGKHPAGIGMFDASACGSPSDSYSHGLAISADGSTIAGISASAAFCDGEAFVWTSGGGMQAIGCPISPVSLCFENAATGVSSDGSVIVGTASQSGSLAAAAWSFSGGAYNCFLGACAAGGVVSAGANAVTPDGTIVVGQVNYNYSTGNPQGFLYNSNGGSVTNVGQLPGGNTSTLVAVNSDGSIAVGSAYDNTEHQTAVLWTPSLGLQRIDSLLSEAGVTGVADWTLATATGISADGTVIVGIGTFGNATAGWIAVLPPEFLPQPLAVSKIGKGKVKSSPPGIGCGATCRANFPPGTTVRLTATPDSGWTFREWQGACAGKNEDDCHVTMSAPESVIAQFKK